MSKEKSAGLVEIRDILKKELNKFSNVQSTLQTTSDGFNKVDTNYSKYESEIDESKKHINELKRKEFYENLFVYIGFGFFMFCVAWVLLKRFPLHQIIFFIYSGIEYIMGIIISLYNNIISYLQSQNTDVSITGFTNTTTNIPNTFGQIVDDTIVRNITKVAKQAAKQIVKNMTK
jgi:hypothetical protein